MSRCVDYDAHRCAVGAGGEMGRLKGTPESNGSYGEVRMVLPAGESLVLALRDLPVCPECAACPATRVGHVCWTLTRAGHVLANACLGQRTTHWVLRLSRAYTYPAC